MDIEGDIDSLVYGSEFFAAKSDISGASICRLRRLF
jgi:hypothetical protein